MKVTAQRGSNLVGEQPLQRCHYHAGWDTHFHRPGAGFWFRVSNMIRKAASFILLLDLLPNGDDKQWRFFICQVLQKFTFLGFPVKASDTCSTPLYYSTQIHAVAIVAYHDP